MGSSNFQVAKDFVADRPFEDAKMEAGFQAFLRLLKFQHRKNFMIQRID